ncbi:hypothetical protein GCM10028793_02450 [Nocardiopsis oceani]
MPLSPFSTAEGGDRGKIIGEKAAERGSPRALTGRDTRTVNALAVWQVSAARPTGVARPPGRGRSDLNHPSPFPDSRQPAVGAERVKVERQ